MEMPTATIEEQSETVQDFYNVSLAAVVLVYMYTNTVYMCYGCKVNV